METKIKYDFAQHDGGLEHRLVPGCKYSWLTPAGILSVQGPLTETEWNKECSLVAAHLGLEPEEHYGRFYECYLVLDVKSSLAALLADRLIMWALCQETPRNPLVVRSIFYHDYANSRTMIDSQVAYPSLIAHDWLQEQAEQVWSDGHTLTERYTEVLARAGQDWFAKKYAEFAQIAGEHNEGLAASPDPRQHKEEKQ